MTHAPRESTSRTTAVSRRSLLGGAGALGALTASQLWTAAEAATLQGSLPTERRRRRGRRRHLRPGRGPPGGPERALVLVVEARDRVGGRVLNHELRTGAVIESGGAFVGPTQDHIIALANELEGADVQ